MDKFKKPGGFKSFGKRPDFHKRDGDRSNFGNKPSFRPSGDREDRQMFTATCDECHKQCEVPFKPTGGKPVYCKDCFASKRDEPERSFDENRPRFPRRDAPSPSAGTYPAKDSRIDDLKRQIDGMSIKLDMVLRLMEKGTSAGKPEKQQDSVKQSSLETKADTATIEEESAEFTFDASPKNSEPTPKKATPKKKLAPKKK